MCYILKKKKSTCKLNSIMSTVTCIEQPGLTLRKKETSVTLC